MDLSLVGTTLLVGIDFSCHCERALLRAVTLAEQKTARIELVHVFKWEGAEAPPGYIGPAPFDRMACVAWEGVMAQARAARSHLGKICSSLVGDRVPAEIRVVIGEPAAELTTAKQVSARLIVLGARGRRARSLGQIGRTAEHVCASSVVPVLLVPDPASAQPLVDIWMPARPLQTR